MKKLILLMLLSFTAMAQEPCVGALDWDYNGNGEFEAREIGIAGTLSGRTLTLTRRTITTQPGQISISIPVDIDYQVGPSLAQQWVDAFCTPVPRLQSLVEANFPVDSDFGIAALGQSGPQSDEIWFYGDVTDIVPTGYNNGTPINIYAEDGTEFTVYTSNYLHWLLTDMGSGATRVVLRYGGDTRPHLGDVYSLTSSLTIEYPAPLLPEVSVSGRTGSTYDELYPEIANAEGGWDNLNNYIPAFMADVNTAGITPAAGYAGTIEFTNSFPGNLNGQARFYNCNDDWDVLINQNSWSSYDETAMLANINTPEHAKGQKMRLVYHELAHAILRTSHTCGNYRIMQSTELSSSRDVSLSHQQCRDLALEGIGIHRHLPSDWGIRLPDLFTMIPEYVYPEETSCTTGKGARQQIIINN